MAVTTVVVIYPRDLTDAFSGVTFVFQTPHDIGGVTDISRTPPRSFCWASPSTPRFWLLLCQTRSPHHTWHSIRLTREHSRIPFVVFSALGNEGCLSGGETLRLGCSEVRSVSVYSPFRMRARRQESISDDRRSPAEEGLRPSPQSSLQRKLKPSPQIRAPQTFPCIPVPGHHRGDPDSAGPCGPGSPHS